MRIKRERWHIESFGPAERHLHRSREVLFNHRSSFQAVEIRDLETYGKALILDSKIQSTAADEFIYHEILVHPGLLLHPEPRRVFIAGGGEGATLREVLRHRTIERVVMVDIDEEVVTACRAHLTEWHAGAFEDRRVELRHLDARSYLENCTETFDAIILDVSDPVEGGPAYRLFTKESYGIVREHLGQDGAVAVQADMIGLLDMSIYAAINTTLRSVFRVVAPYWAFIPSFAVPWGFVIATEGPDPRTVTAAVVDRLLADRVKGQCRYYDGETHEMSFLLPKHVRARLQGNRRLISDDHPLTFR